MQYQPTLESVSQHPLPQWFDDAKFGIFIHWGTYSVPGWAPTGYDVQDLLAGKAKSSESPYAEWYWSNLHQPDSLTQAWQDKTYGPDFKYEQFAPMYNQAMQGWDPGDWASLFKKAGARYVVLTTKHHEGFCLWDSGHANPNRPEYFARRDIVGELTTSVRAQGIRMGLYYSGGLETPVRFTQKNHQLYATLLGIPAAPQVRLVQVDGQRANGVQLLGQTSPLAWQAEGNDLVITLSEQIPPASRAGAAFSFEIQRKNTQ